MLKTESYDAKGQADLTVTMLGESGAVEEEVKQIKYLSEVVKAGVVTVMHGPEMEEKLGAAVLELAGRAASVQTVTTLKSHIVQLLSEQSGEAKDKGVLQAVPELWGPGGALSTMALTSTAELSSPMRAPTLAVGKGGKDGAEGKDGA